MADCIICLEPLAAVVQPPQSPPVAAGFGCDDTLPAGDTADPALAESPTATTASVGDSAVAGTNLLNNEPISIEDNTNATDNVAIIQVCGHSLHDMCLKEWTVKANSCPICRQSFHLVNVYDSLGGNLLSSYKVEDKKQVAEFDPSQWAEENLESEEEEELVPCPICNNADQEEVLLLCDACDAPYHTHCVGLDQVPEGSWFCMECADQFEAIPEPPHARPNVAPRTTASVRRARRRARADDWQGAWGQITGHIFEAVSIDLDHDGDEALQQYRDMRQRREIERREEERWRRRLLIARRLGAQDVWSRSLPADPVPNHARHRPQAPPPPPPESRSERRAWAAMERTRSTIEPSSSSNSRKRTSRSITASPSEPAPEPERRLKRPRTRRVVAPAEASSSKAPATAQERPERNGHASSSHSMSPRAVEEPPSFLSSLLKEVETTVPSDDETTRSLFIKNRPVVDPSSPGGSSPSASAHNSPRAMSATPPPQPHRIMRPSSPTLLTSHIEPIYPPANYSPTRSHSPAGEHSDGEPRYTAPSPTTEVRHPRPRRVAKVSSRSQDSSPTRTPLSLEMKENISSIVRAALKPHWRSKKLSSEEYASINRDVSRKLYEDVQNLTSVDNESKSLWERKATQEVARAMAELTA